MKQQQCIQLSFSFSYGATCSSSSIVSFSVGRSFSFSDAYTCSLAATALHSSGSGEQLSPQLMLGQRLGESHSSSLYPCSRSEERLQRSLRIGSETAPSLSIFCFNSTQQPQPRLPQQQWPAALSFSSSVQQQLQRQYAITFSNRELCKPQLQPFSATCQRQQQRHLRYRINIRRQPSISAT